IRPGDQSLISQPMQWVAAFDVDKRKGGSNAAEPNLIGTLIASRLSAHVIDRKANLLVQPLRADHGGYFPGYMSLKNLWLDLMTRCDHFIDLDFFFAFLRGYFFEDYGLIAALFNPDTVEMGSANAIMKHVHSRFARLWKEPDIERHAKEFEADVL